MASGAAEKRQEEPAAVLPFRVAAVQPATNTAAVFGRDVLTRLLSGLPAAWIVWDASIAVASAAGAYALSPRVGPGQFPDLGFLALHALLMVIAMLSLGLYEPYRLHELRAVAIRTLLAVAVAWVGTVGFFYVVHFHPIGRWVLSTGALLGTVGTLTPRLIVGVAAQTVETSVLLLGDVRGARVLRSIAAHKPHMRLRVNGPLTGAQLRELKARQPEFFRTLDAVVVQQGVDAESVAGALHLIGHGVAVYDLSTFVEDSYQIVPVEEIGLDWFLSARVRATKPVSAALRQLFDSAVAAVGMCLTLPLWPAIALAVKVTSPGPVFYSQLRVGQAGKHFRLLKFRTMRSDAEADGKAVWASKNDSRVTAVGRFLRKSRLDELPQFLNVLRGDMSFVGPRPERPEFVQQLEKTVPHYGFRHLVKPGLTGWAQIMYRYGASEADALEKLRYDLYYIKNATPALDLEIILRTVWAVTKGSR